MNGEWQIKREAGNLFGDTFTIFGNEGRTMDKNTVSALLRNITTISEENKIVGDWSRGNSKGNILFENNYTYNTQVDYYALTIFRPFGWFCW